MPASRLRRQVRVFISSTFRDMQAERDQLVRVVFPELRDRLECLDIDVFEVDLRWGVPQTGLDGERSRWDYWKWWISEIPFFVGILGQKYGWRPPAEDSHDPADRETYGGLSITDMEIRHALKQPPNIMHSAFYLRQTEVPEGAANYDRFVDAADLDDLENLKAFIRQHDQPVREYDCRWTGDGFEDLDCFGECVLEDLWGAILRDKRYVSPQAWEVVLGHDPAEDWLYSDPSAAIPEEVWEKLIAAAKPAPRDPRDVEAEQMARFAESRLQWFQGRARELAALRAFVCEDLPKNGSRLCVVSAAAGIGKTALLARLAEDLAGSDCLLLTHFVGAMDRSDDPRSLLQRLIAELDRAGIHGISEEAGSDLDDLRNHLTSRLQDYCSPLRIVILIDAVDQLYDGNTLPWLPDRLGPSVRLVVSCLDDPTSTPDSTGSRVLSALQSCLPEPLWLRLQPLGEDEVREIIREYLHEYCKELDRSQMDIICAMPQAQNPLYLRAMLDLLRTLGDDDIHLRLHNIIADMPIKHPDALSLFDWMLERLEWFGKDAVGLWCSYLASGRSGMSGEELAGLLARKLGPEAYGTAGYIERDLRPYLQRRGRELVFGQMQLRQAVTLRYPPQDIASTHADIALYMEGRRRDSDPHALRELPYHARRASMPDVWLGAMTDFAYLQAVVEKVDLSEGHAADGTQIPWHAGYFVICDEADAWLNECPKQPEAAELVHPLLQVWQSHPDFVKSGRQIPSALYQDLIALETEEPKEVLDREKRRFVLKGGPLWTWCERERSKYEDPAQPWKHLSTPATTERTTEGSSVLQSRAERGRHDVFISHSSKDKTVADAVCGILESRGIRCWVAPRDILPSQTWAGAIIEGINACRIFVLVFSIDSSCSAAVLKEVQNAAEAEKPILPFRINDAPLLSDMKFHLTGTHWLDALTPPLEQHIEELAEAIELLLPGGK